MNGINPNAAQMNPHLTTPSQVHEDSLMLMPLIKTDAFLQQHPFGTVPAAFFGDQRIGVFESNSILRATVRAAKDPWVFR